MAASQRTEHGREELPHVRSQGQHLGCQAATGQERPRGATLLLRSVAARRSYPASKVRGGQEKPPRARAQGLQLGGATHARGQGRGPGGATPGAVATRVQEGLEELSHVEGQEQRR